MTLWTTDYMHTRQDRWIQTELAFTLAKNATKLNPFEIIPLQTTRKEKNWKSEETLARAVVTLETEWIKGSNPWCLWWWLSGNPAPLPSHGCQIKGIVLFLPTNQHINHLPTNHPPTYLPTHPPTYLTDWLAGWQTDQLAKWLIVRWNRCPIEWWSSWSRVLQNLVVLQLVQFLTLYGIWSFVTM
jgi:hypothetical protein